MNNYVFKLTPGMWRHPDCLDVDFYITKVSYRGPDYYKVRVLYWNRNYKFFHDHNPQTVKIKRVDFKYWSRVET